MATKKGTRRWSQQVTEHSDALTLDEGVFSLSSPRAIAQSLKRSADRSQRRKSSPYRSAISMLTFFINRAGKQLSDARRRKLDAAKDELRRLYGKAPEKKSVTTSAPQRTASKKTTAKKRATVRKKKSASAKSR